MINKIIYNNQLLNHLIIFKFLNKNSRCYKKINSKINYHVLFLLNLEPIVITIINQRKLNKDFLSLHKTLIRTTLYWMKGIRCIFFLRFTSVDG